MECLNCAPTTKALRVYHLQFPAAQDNSPGVGKSERHIPTSSYTRIWAISLAHARPARTWSHLPKLRNRSIGNMHVSSQVIGMAAGPNRAYSPFHFTMMSHLREMKLHGKMSQRNTGPLFATFGRSSTSAVHRPHPTTRRDCPNS